MIETRNLCKSFGNRILFDHLNLTIDDGEFVVLSGHSGCGKTTLLHMIGSLEAFDSGEILIDGLDISNSRNQRLFLRNTVGFVFQNFALIEEKTVEENLKLIHKRNSSGMGMEEALYKVGMADRKKAKVYSLSGGEQQRVALARILMKKCKLILCDEPTGSLDRDNGDRIISMIQEMNKEGKTVVMVTHDEKYKYCGGRLIEL